MRLADTDLVRSSTARDIDAPDAVLSAISSASALAQALVRMPLNEALRECTHLLARFDQLSAPERSLRAKEIALVRMHCQRLRALARCAAELEAIR
jgi:hypothetical protein